MSILGCGSLGWSRRVEWCRRSKARARERTEKSGPKRTGRKERPKRAGRKERPEEIGRAKRGRFSIGNIALVRCFRSVVFGPLSSVRSSRPVLLGPLSCSASYPSFFPTASQLTTFHHAAI